MNEDQATIVRYKAYLKVKQRKCDKLEKLLQKVAPIICSYLCPCVKKDGEVWTHGELCKEIQIALGLSHNTD
jgi:hypothetical protein